MGERGAGMMGRMAKRDDPETIGRRVQELRLRRGLTQRRLAEPSYTPAYVSTVEAGRVRPSDEALRHLADRLGVTFEELATGRPAHLATDLRLRLTEAQRTLLADGEAEEAAAQYTGLLAEALAHGLVEEEATARLGLGECRLDTGDLARRPRALRRTPNAPSPTPRCPPASRPDGAAPSPTTWPANSATPSTSWSSSRSTSSTSPVCTTPTRCSSSTPP
ncbi:hypothetical protein STANM309S_04564 [Streptomyces tanashiensis]